MKTQILSDLLLVQRQHREPCLTIGETKANTVRRSSKFGNENQREIFPEHPVSAMHCVTLLTKNISVHIDSFDVNTTRLAKIPIFGIRQHWK